MGEANLRLALPVVSLAVLIAAVFWLQPRAMSYVGINLLFNLAVPIALATVGQLIIIMVNDIDLSMGAFVSLIACITAAVLPVQPMLGWLALILCVMAYAAIGALIEYRRLPAIVVTLGMSFVWTGAAVLMLPSPGGTAPGWLVAIMKAKTPLVPMAVIASVVIATVAHLVIMRSRFGVTLRALGGNPRAAERSGRSTVALRAAAYGLAAVFAVLAGMALVGLTTSGDANIALRYTLLSIAGVILGGGEFTGGRVSPVGAVIGALTLTLTSSFLSFLRLSPDWQIGAQGAILLAVLAARLAVRRSGARA